MITYFTLINCKHMIICIDYLFYNDLLHTLIRVNTDIDILWIFLQTKDKKKKNLKCNAKTNAILVNTSLNKL